MYSRILVPLDGSEMGERALAHAQTLAKLGGGTVYLIRVFTRHPGSAPAAGSRSLAAAAELARQLEEAEISAAEEYLEHTAADLQGEGIKVETAVHEGQAHEHILEYARQEHVDLIVMSTHGHSGLKRMLLGSITDRVIREGEVPVLVVPPPD